MKSFYQIMNTRLDLLNVLMKGTPLKHASIIYLLFNCYC